MQNWYQLQVDEVLDVLKTDAERGLEPPEAASRLQQVGPNELEDRGVKNPWRILWEQLTGVMVVVLIVSATISAFLHEYTDAVVILIIVVLNALLGFTQEYRAEQAMAALKKMAVPHVRVRREGHVSEISARELVPGDLVLLEAGSAVPADGRVLESSNLRIQEAVLTGESEPVEKDPAPLDRENLLPADQRNMLFMGTLAAYGRGMMVVTETGMSTQLGRIAEMIQTVGQELTPLQRRLDQLGKGLAAAALVIVAIVFGLGLARGEQVRLMFQTAISMAVAAVPEGLPAVVTIALALGAQRMLQRKALIRKLPAVETLGSVTVICSDKTGTLTENRMTVTVLDVAGNRLEVTGKMRDFSPSIRQSEHLESPLLESQAVTLLLAGGALCNDAILEEDEHNSGRFTTIGDPTEGALVVAAAQAGLWPEALQKSLPRIAELPFDSERKRMTTLHRLESNHLPDALHQALHQGLDSRPVEFFAVTKGAVDSLVEVSDRVWVNDHTEALDAGWRERVHKANENLAANGMRVLGVAVTPRPNASVDDPGSPLESGLVFVGLIGMIDPARPEAKSAVKTSLQAGIRPVMITGDHPLTAVYIARQLEISQGGEVVTGQDLAKMDLEVLKSKVVETSVYARVSPEHKLKIVQALQDMGQIVAMTGDGVNDAPALKKADIGVAMGITGTDVSKEAADMVLLDDNFATIVAAVEEGRRIYDNIRKFIRYTLTSNAGEIWVMLLAPFLGMPLPLLPLQILWVNLVTDGLPGLALTIEPAERDIMHRPPYHPKESIFGRGMVRDILWVGLLMGLISLGVGFWMWRGDHATWQTIVFTTLTLAQMGNALAVRSERHSLFQIGLFTNKALLASVLLTFGLQMAVVYLPFLQQIFKTLPLSLEELILCLALSVAVFAGVETLKWVWNRRLNKAIG